MRILVDTNILISAILFPDSKPAKALLKVSEKHKMVLCEQNLSEFREVIKRKAPEYLSDAEVFLSELSYELLPVSYQSGMRIRDSKDQPILNAAILTNVDLLICPKTILHGDYALYSWLTHCLFADLPKNGSICSRFFAAACARGGGNGN